MVAFPVTWMLSNVGISLIPFLEDRIVYAKLVIQPRAIVLTILRPVIADHPSSLTSIP
ncbi:hypothetical protein J21TS7_18220 [Paenibacillus cineris]|uniref:CNNM transmembrane domain-containing protein n=1 Tax=Paenibacillus cineris TaxID=237530 RepID=A0ABQ4LA94_9BACL|nr:hypothetical protein J21TS7_18220 [Paenibacillus cineris]